MTRKKQGKLNVLLSLIDTKMTLKFHLGQHLKLSREERLVLCIGDIIKELIVAQEEGRDVQLNSLKTRLSAKYGLETSPRLVDIIAAVPHDHKKTLLPKLKAKPVRTASGVSLTASSFKSNFVSMTIIFRSLL